MLSCLGSALGVTVSVDEALAVVGRRVSVRRVVGTRQGRPVFTDAVGMLESTGATEVTLRLRDGSRVVIARDSIVAARAVPVRGLQLSGRELEQIAALGWRALATEQLGDWLLRAGDGFTGRANSVLLLGSPGIALSEAVEHVGAWYAAHGLPAMFQVPLPDSAATDRWLAERGWTTGNDVRMLVADLEPLLDSGAWAPRPVTQSRQPWAVQVDDRPDEPWLACYHYRGGDLPGNARTVIENGDRLGFASVRSTADPTQVLAIARGSVDRRWLGVTAVEVTPDLRRRGLARVLLEALARWAGALGAHSCYLQVAADNAPALALYARAGFVDHHRYHYRLPPPSG